MDTPTENNEDEYAVALREEIIGAKRTQTDFLKWKLIAVGAVAGVTFGVAPGADASDVERVSLLLCAIPLICAYTDFISLHIMLSIITIGAYLKESKDPYETFVFALREKKINPFRLEALALHGSSLAFNIVLIALGMLGFFFSTYINSALVSWLYIISGGFGLALTLLSWKLFVNRAEKIANYKQEDSQLEQATSS